MFFAALMVSTQYPSPALAAGPNFRRHRTLVERVFVKALPYAKLAKGLLSFLENDMNEEIGNDGMDKSIVKWGTSIAVRTLSVGAIIN